MWSLKAERMYTNLCFVEYSTMLLWCDKGNTEVKMKESSASLSRSIVTGVLWLLPTKRKTEWIGQLHLCLESYEGRQKKETAHSTTQNTRGYGRDITYMCTGQSGLFWGGVSLVICQKSVCVSFSQWLRNFSLVPVQCPLRGSRL